jgi:hypothetical protein
MSLQYQLSLPLFTWIAVGAGGLHFLLMLLTKAIAVEETK